MSLYSQLHRYSCRQYIITILFVFIVILSYNYYNSYYFLIISKNEIVNNYIIHNTTFCSDVIHVYNLKTNLKGVNYKGSHWFHIAENFLTNHPNSNKYTNNKYNNNTVHHLLYNLDNKDFINDLNGMTRLLITLGTISKDMINYPLYLHFVYIGKDIKQNINNCHELIVIGKSVVLLSNSNKRFIDTINTNDLFHSMIKSGREICYNQLVQTIGGQWPTIQRGHWFPLYNDIQSFRYKINNLCLTNQIINDNDNTTTYINFNSTTNNPINKFKLVIYQRDQSRRIENEDEAIRYIYTYLPSQLWNIKVVTHDSNQSPCDLAVYLSDCDVLVTAHGFQSMLLLFLPSNAILYEIFPYKYYKRAYGPLSKEYGVIHDGVMSSPTNQLSKYLLSGLYTSTCMKFKICRNYARNHDVRFTEYFAVKLSDVIKQNRRAISSQIYN